MEGEGVIFSGSKARGKCIMIDNDDVQVKRDFKNTYQRRAERGISIEEGCVQIAQNPVRRSPRLLSMQEPKKTELPNKRGDSVNDPVQQNCIDKGKRKLQFDDDFVQPVVDVEHNVKNVGDEADCQKRRGRQPKPLTIEVKNRLFFNEKNLFSRKDAEKYISDNFSALEYRSSPRWLVEAMGSLSAIQKKWVISTGLGDVLNFRVKDYPTRLAFLVAQSVEPERDRLKLDSGYLYYSPEDVNAVLGLPLSDVPVKMGPSVALRKEFEEQFLPKKPDEITPRVVCEKIKSAKVVDKWFKWNFLVLMGDLLIISNKASYVNKSFLGFTGDIDNLGNYDWSNYVLVCLKEVHKDWKVDPIKHTYQASIPFLLLMYVDRVSCGKRQIKRVLPTCCGWTSGLLRDRQFAEILDGRFGKGRIKDALQERFYTERSSTEEDDGNDVERNLVGNVDCQVVVPFNIGGTCDPQIASMNVSNVANIVARPSERNVDNVVEGSVHEEDRSFTKFEETPEFEDAFEELEFLIEFAKEIENLRAVYNRCLERKLTAQIRFSENPRTTELELRMAEILSTKCISTPKIIVTPVPEKQASILKQPGSNSVRSGKIVTFDDDVLEKGGTSDVNPTVGLGNFAEPTFDLVTPEGTNICKNLESDFNGSDGKDDSVGVRRGVGNSIVIRPQRITRLTSVKKSPFIIRPVNIRGTRLTETQKTIYDWAVNNEENPGFLVFKWGDVQCTNEQMKTLKEREMLNVSVIDSWTCILNEQENTRGPDSPFRLFCTFDTTMGTMDNIFSKTREERADDFEKNMEFVCGKHNVNPQRLDMIFFPIYEVPHFYVICFNLRTPRIEILDNRRYNQDGSQIYLLNPLCLRDNVVEYLRRVRHMKVEALRYLLPIQLSMTWQTTHNDCDCGIFVMRHMETYYGTPVCKWETDLGVEDINQEHAIRMARGIYAEKILTCTKNEKRQIVIDKAVEHKLSGGGTLLLV